MKYTDKELIVVLDANFVWTQSLFASAAHHHCEVLLLKPKDFRSYKRLYGHYRSDWHPVQIEEGVWEQKLCMPPGWLFHYWKLTEYYLLFFIRRFVRRRKQVSLVLSYPHYRSLWKKLSAKKIYYCFDLYDNYWPGRSEFTQAQEEEAVCTADLVLCTARTRADFFADRCAQHASKVTHISHGSAHRFIWDTHSPVHTSSALDKIPGPRAGYIGGLNHRFDFSFFYQIAQQAPDISFVLGGQPPSFQDSNLAWYSAFQACQSLPNVYFIGYIPNDQLPAYLAGMDIMVLPYARCEFNTYACPMKLWDYMGLRRPIVANTAVPELMLWQQCIYLADQPDEFVARLYQALGEPDWQAEERYTIALQHTWDQQIQKALLGNNTMEKSIQKPIYQ